MNSYEAKQAARKERFLARAEAADAEASQTARKSSDMLGVIPMGQPILIGHHSERGHRALLRRADNAMRKSVDASDKAAYYRGKAAGVDHSGISSDDPDAIDKLKDKLAGMKESQEKMKAANKAIRKHKSDSDRIAALVVMGYGEITAATIIEPDPMGRVGFPAYALSNNNANIRRVAERIEQLEAVAELEDREIEGDSYTYREDVADNRVAFEFDGKPDAATRQTLKNHGFKWSPSRLAWVRKLNAAGMHAGRAVRAALDA
jgi:hypothetical protein